MIRLERGGAAELLTELPELNTSGGDPEHIADDASHAGRRPAARRDETKGPAWWRFPDDTRPGEGRLALRPRAPSARAEHGDADPEQRQRARGRHAGVVHVRGTIRRRAAERLMA